MSVAREIDKLTGAVLDGVFSLIDLKIKRDQEAKLREAHRLPGLARSVPAHTLNAATDISADCLYTGEQIQWDG